MHLTHEEHDQVRLQIYQHIKTLFQVENMQGVDIFSTISRIQQLSEMLNCHECDGQDLSMPRWRILLRLFIAEQRGNTNGLTPTELSHFRQVSKNTISSLLRGLEEQGLVTREMDAKDLRIFRIHLTEKGRLFFMDTAPRRIEGLNQLLSSLSETETQELTALLHKLHQSLERRFDQVQKDLA
jgi:DNA-binding MarR family transcriptional regulator